MPHLKAFKTVPPAAAAMSAYEAIYRRRDIRKFRPDPVPADVLRRILDAAHHAGSVGFMQPWNFIVIRDRAVRESVNEVFQRENARASGQYAGDRAALYKSFKLEGIRESALNVCVTCDRTRGGQVLGRSTIIDTDLFSVCCAVQNLWLAARAEGVGVGWVSIIDNSDLARILGLPDHVVPVAYLCVGYPEEFPAEPMLATAGWRKRIPVDDLIFYDRYGRQAAETLK
ncbi:MAG: 5,6-dimethylbenzimidazole synthase [Elusimicrobia bacterium]|nr:5,6-dimethylbenzimidazole synthase [Elusimicrobiota bacterium]